MIVKKNPMILMMTSSVFSILTTSPVPTNSSSSKISPSTALLRLDNKGFNVTWNQPLGILRIDHAAEIITWSLG